MNATDDTRALLMPIRFAAKRCSVKTATVRRWIKNGVLRGRQLNGRWYAMRADVESLAKEAPNEPKGASTDGS